MTELATWKVHADIGRLDVEVNGDDISSHVRRAALILDRDRIPSLQLELDGTGDLEGVGIVKVVLDETQAELPIGQAVLRFLDQVDPTQLEAAMANGSMRAGVGAAAIAVLRQMAMQ